MKKIALLVIGVILVMVGGLVVHKQTTLQAQTVSEVPTPTLAPNTTAIPKSVQAASLGVATTPTPVLPANAFSYTPLPVHTGPEGDIAEVQPLTPSRQFAQVDDYITFSVGLKNVSGHNMALQSVCFDSSDGNFGCQWGIYLAPGQVYSIQNVGNWTMGGTKTVWVTWTQDGINYYQPLNSNSVRVNIVG